MGSSHASETQPLHKVLRRQRIQELLETTRFLRISDLSEAFGVSEVTVRGDLDDLAERGLIRRVRGGAISPRVTRGEHPFEESIGRQSDAKRRIGRAAAQLLRTGESVLLDVGSTTAAVADAIVERVGRGELTDLLIVTNGLRLALSLEPIVSSCTVVVTGGTLRPLQHSLVDPGARHVVGRLHPDWAFVGCTGVHAEAGITNVNFPEAEMKTMMLAAAAHRVIVADEEKLGRIDTALVCHADEVDLLLTSGDDSSAEVQQLRDAGVEITVA